MPKILPVAISFILVSLIACSKEETKDDPRYDALLDLCLQKHENNIDNLMQDPECSRPEIISRLLAKSIEKSN